MTECLTCVVVNLFASCLYVAWQGVEDVEAVMEELWTRTAGAEEEATGGHRIAG